MRPSKLRESTPPERPDLDEQDCAVAASLEREEIEDLRFEDAPIAGKLASATRCVFRGCDLARLRPAGATLRDCVFERCDLSNVSLAGARLTRVSMVACKGVGLDLSEASATNLSVREGRLSLATCMGASFERCIFTDADLREADFDGATIERVSFAGCRLEGARFPRARVRGLDLSGASIAGLVIEPRSLEELTIDVTQAPALAAALGVTIAD